MASPALPRQPGSASSPLEVEVTPDIPAWRRSWGPDWDFDLPFDTRLDRVRAALANTPLVMEGAGTQLLDEAGHTVAIRWELTGCLAADPPMRPEQARWADVPAGSVNGPFRHHLFHGTDVEFLRPIAMDRRLRGIAEEEGGAAPNVVYMRGWSGVRTDAKAAATVKKVAGSSKAPQGVVLECRAFTRVLTIHHGGHTAELAACRPGLSTHNARSKQWVVHERDVQLLALLLVL